MSNPIVIVGSLLKASIAFIAILLLLGAPAHAQSSDDDLFVEIPFTSRLKVDDTLYTGELQVKAAIIDEARRTLWSNDGSSTDGAQPTGAFSVDVTRGAFIFSLGQTGTDPLPSAVFAGSGRRFALIWIDAGRGFERFDPLPMGTAPRAANAYRLGGYSADEFYRVGQSIPIDNGSIIEPITSGNLAAFSNGTNNFTIGDGNDTDNKMLLVNRNGGADPALRFNTTTNTWQFSNDGTAFADVGTSTASEFNGPGSLTGAVDLNTTEVAGVLPVEKGGTAGTTSVQAQINLGVRVGVDVQAFTLNNFAATTDPGATNDSSQGYAVGSRWLNTSSNEEFICVVSSAAAAVWRSTTNTDANSIEDGSIATVDLADGAVSSAKILDGSIGAIDIAPDTISAANLAPNSVTGSELSPSGVAPGTYTVATVTVDDDGRITAASNGAPSAASVSSVGDSSSGATFGDGALNGTMLIYEGTSTDAFETRLQFAGDPTQDYTLTIPNVTGMLITSGDTGSVTTPMIANSAIDSAQIADNAVTGAKIAVDAVGASEIAADSIGPSELAPTAVAAGSYTLANITVDADGRIISASSNTATGDISAVGDVTTGPAFVDGALAGTELVYEGTTIDAFENRLAFAGDPAADTIVTVPNITGTLVTTGDSATVTGTMVASDTLTAGNLAADSVGNSEIATDAVGAAEILADAVGSAEIAADAVGSSEIAVDAVGASELAATAVAAGSYTLANITVDADGRITSASSNTETGDISAVGDVTTGPAFVDGVVAGSELIYEGTTIDAFENRLAFAGDPAADTIVTVPNITGTLVTTGDSATVTGTMVASDTLTAGNLAADSVGNSEIATDAVGAAEILADAVGSAEIAADAVGASELAATAVAAGSYTLANITVDADGRITSASSNTETGDISAVGDVTTGPAFVDGVVAGSELIYEGTTIDAFENRLAFVGDPAADSIVTVPNTTGTLVTTGDSATVTGAMVAVDTLTAGNLAADSVGSSEIATDAVSSAEILTDAVGSAEIAADAVGSSEVATDAIGSAEILADAVGSAELAATAVAAGSYTLANITVDADGRITAASSNTETGDISAVGDVTTGPAFVDGVVAGTELIYEGTTIDAFENRLAFAGDPAADTIVTVPNTTGTLVTTGDSATVTGTIVAGDTLTAVNLAADSVASSEIAADAVGSSEVATDAIGPAELAATAVAAGSYTLANITVDADGRITAASSNTETGDISAVGDVTTGPAFVDGVVAGTELIYEGTTIDAFENRLAFAGDPAADTIVTVPNVTGTLVTTGDSATVTGTMVAADTLTAGNLSADSVGSSEIATDAVSSAEILADAVGSAEIAADAVGSSEVATDAIGSAEILADAVGPAELAATAVAAGSYTLANITVDADGRITAASSSTETGDISAVGDVTTGPAFVDGVVAGSELIYEGTTIDAFENRLAFAGDPAADTIVTVPNTTGTLVTTGDSATVTGTMVAGDTLTAGNLAADSVGNSEIATDAVGSAEIAVDAVGSAELAATAVAAGSYTLANITVDADGRITSASSSTETGDISAVGDVTSGPAFVDGVVAGSELIYEGSTIDAFENRLVFSGDPAADTIVTVPNVTGTLVTTGDSATVTGTMVAGDTLTAGNLAADSVGSSEIATDAVGAAELAATAVAAGSYTLANITVDADGRITSASSSTETGDISAVGDVTTGPAFVDGVVAGSELIYEGTTIDAFENRLAFAGDPAADTIVTVPNVTGTLVTTGDSATVTGTMVAGDTLTAGNLAADSVGSSEIATDAVGSAEIAADAVGSSEIATDAIGSAEILADAVGPAELAATAVAAGSYTLANITVDADGRITAASSSTETGDISAVGDVTTGPAFVDGVVAGTELIYEGTSIDAFENRLAFAGDPAADTIVTVPNTTGTLVTTGDSATVTGTMVAGDTLTAGNFAADSVGSSEIASDAVGAAEILADAVGSTEIAADAVGASEVATDAIGAAEILADAVGPSELAATTVAAGSYTLANITVDADGRITTASSSTETGDISAVGDVTTGPAFVDGVVAGIELIYEGSTIDAFENRLTFAGDPAADTIVTVPNTTGTLVTTGDSATVTGTMVAGDSLTAGNLAADSVGSSEIATDAVGAAEILADAVGPSELAATTVAAGSYTLANITVDADGRITTASSSTETGDISAVGDVSTGPAFVDGVVAGTELVYEGSTVDAFENRLAFAGDPAADTIVTVPSTTGTLVTTGDSATVTGTMVAGDTLAAGNLAADSVGSSEIATDAVGSAEIAADAVGPSELAATAVAAGSYTLASITVDADGRITAASSGSEAGDITAVGDVTTGPAFVDGTNAGSELVFEGATVDGFENRLQFTGNPAADTIVSIPNTTGTLVTTGDSGSVTSTMVLNGTLADADIAAGAAISYSKLAALNTGQVLLGNGTTPTATTLSGDATVSATGVVTIASAAVGSAEITDASIAAGDIANDTITATQIATGAVATAEILDGTIVNADVSASAAIAYSKLANLSTGQILLGNGTTPTATAMSGDATIGATGTVTIANNAIGSAEITDASVAAADIVNDTITATQIATGGVATAEILDGTILNADVGAAAAIVYSKLAAMNTGQVLLGNGTTPTATALSGDATVSATGVVTIASGAIGAAEITDGTIANADVAAAAAIAYSKLAALNTGQILLGNGTTPTATAMSGDATIGATGTVTIANNAIGSAEITDASIAAADIVNDTITATQIATGGVATAEILDGTILNADVGAAAAIAYSKLAAMSTGQILLGNGTTPTATAMSGDATIGATGTVTIANNAIGSAEITNASIAAADIVNDTITATQIATGGVATAEILDGTVLNADVGAAAAIAYSKLAAMSTGQVLLGNGTTPTATALSGDATVSATGVVTIASGAIGAAEITDGTIANADVAAAAAIAYSKLAALNTGQILLGNGTTPTATAMSGDATIGATGTVTIANNAIGSAEITNASIAAADIVNDTITATQIATGGVATAEILDGTILNADVGAAAAIAYSKLAAMSTGQVLLGNGTTPTATALSGDATVSATGVVTIASNAVGTAEITDATIANADIAAAAAIAYNKLAALNTGQVLLGNGTTPTATTLSGDATVGATGTVTIAANAVDGTNISIASEGTGDLMLFNGTDWSRLAAGASGELLTGNGAGVAPSWQTASSITGTLLQHPVLSRRVGLGLATATNATTFTGIGIPNPTVLGGAGTANPAIVGATNFFINYATTAVSANANGLGGAFTQTRPAYRPKLSAVIRTDSTGGASIANTRMWVGITEATLAAIVTNTSGTTASTTDFVGVAYDTNGTGNTTDWLCCSGDGANYGCTTTGVAVATNTDYTIIVDWTTGGNLVCTVNGTSVSKGTNLSTNAVNLGTQISITTLSAAVRNFNIAKYSIEQN